jgi:lysophospholipase L1-like esterase
MLAIRKFSKKLRFVLVGVALLGVGIGMVAFRPSSRTDSGMASTSIRYLALGDSYTIGESVSESERWPMQLRDSLQTGGIEVEWYKIIARTGWKTKDLKEAIAASNVDADYDLVSLCIGVNDFFQGRGLEEYKQRFQGLLETAVKLARGRKDRVFVVSIPDYAFTPLYQDHRESISRGIDDFNTAAKRATIAFGVQFIDITPISRKGLEDPQLVARDGLHPAGKQYTAWVKLIQPTVLEMLAK